MTSTTRTGRTSLHAPTLLLIVALALGLIAGLAPSIARQAETAVPVKTIASVETTGSSETAWPPPPSAARIRRQIVWVAASQVGQKETGNNYYPDRYKLNDQIVRPAAWCGIFAHWAWHEGGVARRPNMNTAGTGLKQGHWATYWQKWGQDTRRWKPITARKVAVGDVVVYGNFPDPGHVGVVIGVWNVRGRAVAVRTVEGNLDDKVTDTGWRNITQLKGRGLEATGFVSPVQLPR